MPMERDPKVLKPSRASSSLKCIGSFHKLMQVVHEFLWQPHSVKEVSNLGLVAGWPNGQASQQLVVRRLDVEEKDTAWSVMLPGKAQKGTQGVCGHLDSNSRRTTTMQRISSSKMVFNGGVAEKVVVTFGHMAADQDPSV